MNNKSLTLTEDHIKLICLFKFEHIAQYNRFGQKIATGFFIDEVNPYILSGNLADLALALGLKDKAIEGTEEDPEGAAFPDEVVEYLQATHRYIVDNMCDIESLIHQMAFEGGLTAGTYTFSDEKFAWVKE